MARIVDPELAELRLRLGNENYRAVYRGIYSKTLNHGEARFSGKHYKNSPERISALREKYKNGVPDGTIEKMLGLKNGETAEEC